MAQKTTVEYVDDLDGQTEAEETVTFAIDGATYEIDLTAEHANRLRDDLSTWVGHARRTSVSKRAVGKRPAPTGRTSDDRAQKAAVRSWARDAGYEISDRGRISALVQEAYDAAH